MIAEEYVTFETAKLLKEAGFPQENGYNIETPDADLYMWYDIRGSWRYGPLEGYYVNAPTQAQAMRWLREERYIYVNLNYDGYHKEAEMCDEWSYRLYDGTLDCFVKPAATLCTTYEAAVEAGIQAACNYLIKNKQQ